jgi:hypothetical protein
VTSSGGARGVEASLSISLAVNTISIHEMKSIPQTAASCLFCISGSYEKLVAFLIILKIL